MTAGAARDIEYLRYLESLEAAAECWDCKSRPCACDEIYDRAMDYDPRENPFDDYDQITKDKAYDIPLTD